MLLLAWILFSLGIVAVLWRTPAFVVVIIISLRIAIPAEAGSVFTGNWSAAVAIHPSTLLLAVFFPFWALKNARSVADAVRRDRLRYAILGVICVAFVAFTVAGRGVHGLSGLTNVVIAPIVLVVVVHSLAGQGIDINSRIVSCLLTLAVGESALIFYQHLRNSPVLWEAHQGNPWSRPLGTFDSPLDAAFFLVVSIPLLSRLKSTVLQVALGTLFLAAVVATASRAPALAGALSLAWLVVCGARTGMQRVVGLVLAACAGIYGLHSEIASGLLDRFNGDDGNSAFARSIAFEYLRVHLWDHPLVGAGWGSTTSLKGTVLQTSLENGYGVFALDLGVAGTCALIAVQVSAVVRPVAPTFSGARVSLLCAVGLGFAYSGFSTMSATGMLLWLMYAMTRESGGSPVLRGVKGPSAATYAAS